MPDFVLTKEAAKTLILLLTGFGAFLSIWWGFSERKKRVEYTSWDILFGILFLFLVYVAW